MLMKELETDYQATSTPSLVINAVRPASEAVDLAVLNSFEEAQPEEGPDLVVELIDLYLSETARLIASVQESIVNEDQSSIRRAVHSLRGSSSSLGILQMALICDELERTEFTDLFPIASELLSCLEQEFGRVSKILRSERQRRVT